MCLDETVAVNRDNSLGMELSSLPVWVLEDSSGGESTFTSEETLNAQNQPEGPGGAVGFF